MLDVSRIVTGKLHLDPAPVVLEEIVRAAVATIRPAAEAKRQRLDVDVDSASTSVLGVSLPREAGVAQRVSSPSDHRR